MAEYQLQTDLIARGIDDVLVSSAGTIAIDGNRAAEDAISIMAQNGVDISAHRARRLTKELVDEADLVLAMDRSHLYAGRELAREQGGKVILMGEVIDGIEYPIIDDPYGRSFGSFEHVYDMIHKASQIICEKIIYS
jgi:protein-tyrosine phosphatase